MPSQSGSTGCVHRSKDNQCAHFLGGCLESSKASCGATPAEAGARAPTTEFERLFKSSKTRRERLDWDGFGQRSRKIALCLFFPYKIIKQDSQIKQLIKQNKEDACMSSSAVFSAYPFFDPFLPFDTLFSLPTINRNPHLYTSYGPWRSRTATPCHSTAPPETSQPMLAIVRPSEPRPYLPYLFAGASSHLCIARNHMFSP